MRGKLGFASCLHRNPILILLSLPKGRDPAAPLMPEINFVSRHFSAKGSKGERGVVCAGFLKE